MASEAALELIVNLKDNASKGLGGIAKSTGFLKDALSFAAGGLIQKGIEGVTGAVGDFFSSGIDEAQGWNAAMAQTEAVIKSTGGAAGLSAQQMGDLAASLSGGAGVSLASDDAVLAGENLLATFTNIGKDTFPRATATMVDMAQAMGTDVKGGAIQLGKALNDPIAGIGALSRVGVTFTAQQKEQIKAMVQAGDAASAQGVILSELEKEFGGSAAAAAKADGGMFQLSEQMANVKQTVGDALLPILHELAGFISSPAVIGALQGLATLLANGLTAGFGLLKNILAQVLPPIQAFAAILGQAFGGELKLDTLQALPGWLQPLGALFGAIAENVGEFFRAIQGGADPLAALGELIKNNFLDLLPKVGDLLAGLGGVLATAFTGALDFLAQNALPAIGGALQAIGSGIAGAIDSILAPQVTDGMGKVGGGFFDWVGTEVLPRIGEVFGTIAGAIGEWITGGGLAALVSNLARWGQALIDWIGPMIPPLLGKLGELLGTVGAWLLNTGLPTLIKLLGEWGGALINWIAKDALPFIGQKLAEFGAAIWQWLTGGGLAALIANMQQWGQGLTNWVTKDALPFIGGKLAEFGQAIWNWLTGGGLTALILNMQAWGQGLLNWIGTDALPFIGEKLTAFGQAIWTWLTSAEGLGALIKNMQAWGAGLTDWVTKDALPFIGGKLGEFAQAIWTWITKTAADIVVKAAGIGQGLIDGLTNSIKAGASQVIGALGGVVTGAIDNAKNLLGIHSPSEETASIGGFLVQGLTGGLTAGAPTVQTAVQTLATTLLTSLQTALAPAAPLFAQVLLDMTAALAPHLAPDNPDGLLGLWGTTPTSLLSMMYGRLAGDNAAAFRPNVRLAMAGTMTDLGNAIDSAAPGIVSAWLDGMLTPMKTGMTEAAAAIVSVGTDMMAGLAGGINAGTGFVVDAAVAAVQAAIDAAKAAAGIASPSKLMAVQIGVPLMEGAALGVTHAAAVLAEAMQTSVTGAIPLLPAPGSPGTAGGGASGGVAGGGITVWVMVPGLPYPVQGQATTQQSVALRWQQELGRL